MVVGRKVTRAILDRDEADGAPFAQGSGTWVVAHLLGSVACQFAESRGQVQGVLAARDDGFQVLAAHHCATTAAGSSSPPVADDGSETYVVLAGRADARHAGSSGR